VRGHHQVQVVSVPQGRDEDVLGHAVQAEDLPVHVEHEVVLAGRVEGRVDEAAHVAGHAGIDVDLAEGGVRAGGAAAVHVVVHVGGARGGQVAGDDAGDLPAVQGRVTEEAGAARVPVGGEALARPQAQVGRRQGDGVVGGGPTVEVVGEGVAV